MVDPDLDELMDSWADAFFATAEKQGLIISPTENAQPGDTEQ